MYKVYNLRRIYRHKIKCSKIELEYTAYSVPTAYSLNDSHVKQVNILFHTIDSRG